jgi:uncharacterized membrane protein YjgN (DUF898 family)
MSDWGWVALAYTIVYATLGVYTAWLLVRLRRHGGDSR